MGAGYLGGVEAWLLGGRGLFGFDFGFVSVSVIVFGEGVLEFPTEAAGLVFVDGFDDEEDSADFEEGAADEGGDAACCAGLVGEGGAGVGQGKPVEEAADDEQGAADGEEEGDEEGDAPPGEGGGHAADSSQDCFAGGRWRWRWSALVLVGTTRV